MIEKFTVKRIFLNMFFGQVFECRDFLVTIVEKDNLILSIVLENYRMILNVFVQVREMLLREEKKR